MIADVSKWQSEIWSFDIRLSEDFKSGLGLEIWIIPIV